MGTKTKVAALIAPATVGAIRYEALRALRDAGYADSILEALSKPRPNITLAGLPRDRRSANALFLISTCSQFDNAWSRRDWRSAAEHAFNLGRQWQTVGPETIPASLREKHKVGARKSAAARRNTRATVFDPLMLSAWPTLPSAAKTPEGLSEALKKLGHPRSARSCREDIKRLGLR